MELGENLRKLVLAGIGAASVAAEKTQETLDQLAQRGEDAVKRGKAQNERLRHDVQETIKEHVTVVEEAPADKDSVLAALEHMTKEERGAILAKLNALAQEDGAHGA